MNNQISLIYDVDDTLYRRSSPFIQACQDVFGEKMQLDWEAVYARRSYYSEQVFEASQKGEISMEEMYEYRLGKALLEFGYETCREEALYFEERYHYFQDRICLDDPFDALLGKFREEKVPQAILSNGPSAHQRRKLRALGVDAYIPESMWLVSGDIGVIKPHPEIFRHAESLFSMEADRIWYVGDNYACDIEGAKKAGWHAIWYNHRQEALPAESRMRPDRIATDRASMKQVLAELLQDA